MILVCRILCLKKQFNSFGNMLSSLQIVIKTKYEATANSWLAHSL